MFQTEMPSGPVNVIPPKGWKDTGGLGFLRAKDAEGQPVDLVRLSDLIRWIESSRRIPRPDAIQIVLDSMPDDVMQWLYSIADSKWAEPVSPNDVFGGQTAASLLAAKQEALRNAQNQELAERRSSTVWGDELRTSGRFGSALTMNHGRISALAIVVPVEPGRNALQSYLGRLQRIKTSYKKDGSTLDMLDKPNERLARLAMPRTKAHSWLGWGTVEHASVAPVKSQMGDEQIQDTVQFPSNPQRGLVGRNTPVRPMKGWSVQSIYGTLKTLSGELLVRLEDVHDWLYENGLPATDAVYKIFGPFYEACLSVGRDDEDALALLGRLYVLNALTHPSALWIGGDRSKAESVKVFSTGFPDLGHVRFEDGSIGGLVYSIAEGAKRIWHGVADLNTDHLARWKDRQDRESDRKYQISWPKDDDLRKLLGRIAVPIVTAYELWGWGTVAEIVPLHATPIAAKEPETWGELLPFRKANSETAWNPKQKNIVAAEKTTRDKRPGAKGVAKAMAEELGVTVSRLNELIRTKDEDGKRTSRARQHKAAATGLRSI